MILKEGPVPRAPLPQFPLQCLLLWAVPESGVGYLVVFVGTGWKCLWGEGKTGWGHINLRVLGLWRVLTAL